MVELGAVAFFASGVAEARIGPSAPWFVLGAVIVGFLLRAVDIEARSLFVPGGLFGSVRETLGGGLATIAVSTHVAERLLLGPVAAAVAGRYAVRFLSVWAGADDVRAGLVSDVSTAAAVALLAYVWWIQRRGRWFTTQTISRTSAAVVTVLVIAVGWGAVTAHRSWRPPPAIAGASRIPWRGRPARDRVRSHAVRGGQRGSALTGRVRARAAANQESAADGAARVPVVAGDHRAWPRSSSAPPSRMRRGPPGSTPRWPVWRRISLGRRRFASS